MSRGVLVVVCAGLLLASGSGEPRTTATRSVAAAPAASTLAYSAPVGTPVVVLRAFIAPSGPFGAGHRGADLATSPGESALAAAGGQVRFAGIVAGRGVVVIEHPDGILTEYEPLTPTVAAGGRVLRGQPIGLLHGAHSGCEPSRCLHWGARRAGAYFDPMTLLARLGPVRLLPWTP